MPAPEALPVFYTDRQVAEIDSFSPSAGKPAKVVSSWRKLGIPLRIVAPAPATVEDFCRAHDRNFVAEILACRRDNGFGNRSAAVAASLPWTSGSMLSAAREALANQLGAIAPCSGFHHAGYAYCGGYCTFNGLMVVTTAVIAEGRVRGRIGIVDCDHHYGNGTQDIIDHLHLGQRVRHFSAGRDYTGPEQGRAFLARLPKIVSEFADCDLLLFQAGADPHLNDALGGWLSTDQLAARDRIVFETARSLDLPVAWNLAGGYQDPLRRVLDIHDGTLVECAKAWQFRPTPPATRIPQC